MTPEKLDEIERCASTQGDYWPPETVMELLGHIRVLKAAKVKPWSVCADCVATTKDAAEFKRKFKQAERKVRALEANEELLRRSYTKEKTRADNAEAALRKVPGWCDRCKAVHPQFPCCGGSDEHPPEHTQDCETCVPKREWHGCADPRGHSFSEGVCQVEGCGYDLRKGEVTR